MSTTPTLTSGEPRPSRDREPSGEQRRRTLSRGAGRASRIPWGGYVPLVLTVLMVVLPLAWMLLSSVKPTPEILTTDLKILPRDPTLENYESAMSSVPFGRFFLNSLIVTAVGSTIKVLLAILTAYALVFVRFPFKNAVFVLILVALMVPPQVSVLPNFLLITELGGRNTLWGIILPGLGTAFGTFLLRQHFLTLPGALVEAAEVDGAGHLKRLWQIIVPVSMPTIATVGLVTIVNEWNEYIWPLIIVDNPDVMTLPVGLTLLQNSEGNSAWGVLMAGAVLVIIPVLIIFALLQRHIVAGLTQGAVTG